jgi:hypothetical protein
MEGKGKRAKGKGQKREKGRCGKRPGDLCTKLVCYNKDFSLSFAFCTLPLALCPLKITRANQ